MVINGNLSLAISTRYFHTHHHHTLAIPQTFGPGVNPNGILKTIAEDTYIHMEENVVQYLGRKGDDWKSFKYVFIYNYKNSFLLIFFRYVNVNPIWFQVGDIVKISISFFCVQIHGQKMKMMMSLKTLMILDDTIKQVIILFLFIKKLCSLLNVIFCRKLEKIM